MTLSKLKPAFQELWIYPVALAGVFCAPVLAAATTNEPVHIVFDVGAFAIALVVTAIFVIATELRGTKEQKKTPRIRLLRYALAFMAGVLWRMLVPLSWEFIKKAFGG